MKVGTWIRDRAKRNRNSLLESLRLGVISFLTFILILVLGFQGYAQVRGSAVVRTVTFGNGDRNMFRLTPSATASSRPITEIPANQRRIDGEGELSVPNDGESLASFYFERGSESSRERDYGGLVVQTRPDRRTTPPTTNYKYPCRFNGQLIIAWPSNGSARTCDNEQDGRIEIVTDPQRLLSYTQSRELASKYNYSTVRKQDTSEEASDENLAVSPGDGATVIRTTARTYTEVVPGPPERCDRDFFGDYCQVDITQTRQAINIEVLEGDVLIESEQKPSGTRVRKGERYSYPSEDLVEFNVNEAALSCETLRFLNPAYWLDSDTPPNVADGITQQLKGHRDSLGISGQPPNDLSNLENALIAELNSLRSDPNAYADLLEQQKQFYYDNWLRLRGETLDISVRRRAVDEAITFLRSQRNLSEFSVSTGLSMASKDHVNDQGRTGMNFGHTGDDGSGYWNRIRRHGTVECGMNENVSYYDSRLASNIQSEAQIVLIELIIDDGQRQAGSRDNIFNQDFQVIGVACGPHGNFLRQMCDITYANGYLEN
ncbi:CAP domain-containing protein [Leptolyngbya sp. CCNP1308]|uniref:CAP domain-containing protein n=1 Tax=Leptolyngbya sp. CCNP1308 TaxID=3110255 RepID=UPI002B1F78E9|nr:CAP domain-containing protein [Leptolyngbya sp. CCNP1308]MEA5450949.1 CAP domain-containing protein [Leptolyngbya sp. CCNP1308]